MDRRGAFFLLAGAMGAGLAFVADEEHRWVAIAVAIVYALFAVASFLDRRSRDRIQPRRRTPK
jgi:hypothetical protein